MLSNPHHVLEALIVYKDVLESRRQAHFRMLKLIGSDLGEDLEFEKTCINNIEDDIRETEMAMRELIIVCGVIDAET